MTFMNNKDKQKFSKRKPMFIEGRSRQRWSQIVSLFTTKFNTISPIVSPLGLIYKAVWEN